jgi:hypothetical protein
MTQRSPLAFVVRDIALFERPTVLRMPFRFGAATVTACPQAFVRVQLDIGGKIVQGASAELMVPKWFDKAPLLSHDDNFNQLRQALLLTRAAYLATPHAPSAWILSPGPLCGTACLDLSRSLVPRSSIKRLPTRCCARATSIG